MEGYINTTQFFDSVLQYRVRTSNMSTQVGYGGGHRRPAREPVPEQLDPLRCPRAEHGQANGARGRGAVLHAADEELSNQNELTEEGLGHIVANFREWATEERVSRTVSLDEIRENDYNLNIALYVDTTEPEEDIDVEEELATLRELQAERDKIESRMNQHMEALNYE